MHGENINILASCNIIESRVLLLIEDNDVPVCVLFLNGGREIGFLLLADFDRRNIMNEARDFVFGFFGG